jgi:hypothetical protein
MKDMFGVEIKVGDRIAYALISGRSAVQAVYDVFEVGDLYVKAHKIAESGHLASRHIDIDGELVEHKYCKFNYDDKTGVAYYTKRSQKEIDKINSKTVTLSGSHKTIVLKE